MEEVSPRDLREDGTTAALTVDHAGHLLGRVPDDHCVRQDGGSRLRPIACDGYDPATGTFAVHDVVYARLVI
ncbi:hypothetical protein ACX80H_04660 [Arthrobacter sp. MDT2-2]